MTSESEDILIWENHTEHAQSNLKLCLIDEKYCDLVFITKPDEKRIPVHRVILYTTSQYFQTMFDSSFKESNEKEIVIDADIKGDTLQLIIDFCYYGKITITKENVEELLSAADLMQFKIISKRCAEFMLKNIDENNCLGIAQFLKPYEFTEVSKAVNEFIYIHFVHVITCEEYFKLNIGNVTELLSREDISIDSEDDVVMALKNWVTHDWRNRKSYVLQLLDLIKLPLVSKNCFWFEVVRWLGLEEEPFKNIFADVIEYHLTTIQNSQIANGKIIPRMGVNRLITVSGFPTVSIKIQNINEIPKLICNRTKNDDVHDCQVVYSRNKYFLAYINSSYLVLEYFNVIEKQWISLSSQITYLSYYSMAYYKDKLYFMGGRDCNSYHNSMAFYLETKTMQTNMLQMKYPRYCVGVKVVDNNIFVIGGTLQSQGISSNKVEFYTPDRNTWTECSSLNVARRSCKVVFFNGYLYVIGSVKEVERYKPGGDNWELVAPLPLANCQAACVLSNRIIVVCRTNPKCRTNKWFEYNHIKDCWNETNQFTGNDYIRFLFSIPASEIDNYFQK